MTWIKIDYLPQKLSNVHDQPRSIMEVKKSFRYLKIKNISLKSILKNYTEMLSEISLEIFTCVDFHYPQSSCAR